MFRDILVNRKTFQRKEPHFSFCEDQETIEVIDAFYGI